MNIRNSILKESPFSDLVRERYSKKPTENEALEYSLEGLLRSLPSMNGLDGFNDLHVCEETSTTLKIIGLTYFLPDSLLPLEASLSIENGNIIYRVLLGLDDKKWNTLTDSKRWKVVYLYATQNVEAQWNWGNKIEGQFSKNCDSGHIV